MFPLYFYASLGCSWFRDLISTQKILFASTIPILLRTEVPLVCVILWTWVQKNIYYIFHEEYPWLKLLILICIMSIDIIVSSHSQQEIRKKNFVSWKPSRRSVFKSFKNSRNNSARTFQPWLVVRSTAFQQTLRQLSVSIYRADFTMLLWISTRMDSRALDAPRSGTVTPSC